MKTYLINIVLAKKPLEALTNKHYRNFAIALRLAELKKLVNEKSDFYIEQERNLVLQYSAKDDNGNPVINDNGQITFVSMDDANKFSEEIIRLKTTEVDIGRQIKIRLQEDIKDDQDTLTPEEILQLSDLIKFEVNEPVEDVEDHECCLDVKD